jgi:hypothetical protein
MADPRRSAVFVIRIWREPSRLAPPGEWRGTLREVSGSQNLPFKSADELWRHLTGAYDDAAPGSAGHSRIGFQEPWGDDA